MRTQTDPKKKHASQLASISSGMPGAAVADRGFMLCGECPSEQASDLATDPAHIEALAAKCLATIDRPPSERCGLKWLVEGGCEKELGRVLDLLSDPLVQSLYRFCCLSTSLIPIKYDAAFCPEGHRRINSELLPFDAPENSCDSFWGDQVFRWGVHDLLARLAELHHCPDISALQSQCHAINSNFKCIRACENRCLVKCTAFCRDGGGKACCSGFGTPGSKCLPVIFTPYLAAHKLVTTCLAVDRKPVVVFMSQAAEVPASLGKHLLPTLQALATKLGVGKVLLTPSNIHLKFVRQKYNDQLEFLRRGSIAHAIGIFHLARASKIDLHVTEAELTTMMYRFTRRVHLSDPRSSVLPEFFPEEINEIHEQAGENKCKCDLCVAARSMAGYDNSTLTNCNSNLTRHVSPRTQWVWPTPITEAALGATCP